MSSTKSIYAGIAAEHPDLWIIYRGYDNIFPSEFECLFAFNYVALGSILVHNDMLNLSGWLQLFSQKNLGR